MNNLRPIRLTKAWRGRQPGFVFSEMPAGAAQTLVARGFAEYCDEQVKAAPVTREMNARKPKQKTQAA
jgi:hypothetical protein